jgi:hypothetical protein
LVPFDYPAYPACSTNAFARSALIHQLCRKKPKKQRAKETVLLHKTPRPLRHMPDDLTAGFPHSDLSSFIRPQTLQVFLTGNLLFLHEQNDFILIGIRNMTKIIFHHINVSS